MPRMVTVPPSVGQPTTDVIFGPEYVRAKRTFEDAPRRLMLTGRFSPLPEGAENKMDSCRRAGRKSDGPRVCQKCDNAKDKLN